ncbi:MAG: sugar transferase [Pseudomonadota bacterium]
MENQASSPARSDDRAVVYDQPNAVYAKSTKRGFDLVVSIMLLPILIPIICLLYVPVRMSGGPGFFGHKRVGRDGRIFLCWKLRTMVPDAEERLRAVLASDPEARKSWEADRKLRNDPRITKFGEFLRKTSLDELPQIFNVLKGEMSLIGPRPVTPDELDKYGASRVIYLAMRPGVTGLWQVSGRNDVSYSERVMLDRQYFATMSLRVDMTVLVRTTGAVLRRTGI